MSAGETHGRQVMGIVLSGGGSDGAAGLRAVAEHGGMTLVQNPDEAAAPSMPFAAIMANHPDVCLPIEDIVRHVRAFCFHGTAV
jgi:two-component system chemotaxis response regulator CheB